MPTITGTIKKAQSNHTGATLPTPIKSIKVNVTLPVGV